MPPPFEGFDTGWVAPLVEAVSDCAGVAALGDAGAVSGVGGLV